MTSTQRVAALAIVIATLEQLLHSRVVRDGGLMSWSTGQVARRWTSHVRTLPVLDRILADRPFLLLLSIRGALAFLLIFCAVPLTLGAVGWAAVLVVSLLSFLRTPYGADGADQMLIVIAATLTVANLDRGSGSLAVVAGQFLTLQVLLAYASSGVAKVLSPLWRKGNAVSSILLTRTYGHQRLGQWLGSRPLRGRVVSWSTIVFECGFPLAAIIDERVLAVWLLCGLFFHVGIAASMGLNTFLFAFVACYPTVWYFAPRITSLAVGACAGWR